MIGRVIRAAVLAAATPLLTAGEPALAQTGDGGAEVYVFGNSLVHHLGDEAHSNVPYWLAQMADAGGRELSLEGQWGFLRDFAGGLPPRPNWSFPEVSGFWVAAPGPTRAWASQKATMASVISQ